MIRGIWLLWFPSVLFALVPFAAGAEEAAPSVRVEWTTTPPTIDGVLDDSVWKQAALLGPLTQVIPKLGAPPTQRTEVRILTDQHHLYFAIRCLDDDASKIVSQVMLRDSIPWSEDQVIVVVDTFHDRRNGYGFVVTSAGGRSDVLLEGEQFLTDWDTIWFAKTRIDAEGWSAEIAIPYQSVNFDPEGDAWGFNIGRVIARNDEEVRWADISVDREVANLGRAGTLEGLRGIQQGLGLDVVPTFTLRREDEYIEERHTTTADPSLDVFYKLTPGLTAAATVNTDFSESEVDSRQVDLSRFDLFFPEQRAFFLQDATIFDFAALQQNARPFFSRRIGLADDGEPVDIRVGGKVTGREGPVSLGLLGVNQDSHDDIDSATLAVGRVALNVLEESRLGVIATHGDPSSNRENNLVGTDFQYRDSDFRGRTLTGKAWYQHSFSGGVDGKQAAFGGEIAYPNDVVNWLVGFQEIQKRYRPGLGFVNRTDIRRYDASYRYRIRPEEGLLRTIDSEVAGVLVTDMSNKAESGLLTVRPLTLGLSGFGAEGEPRDALELRYEHQFERLLVPFEISPGVILPVDRYHFDEGAIRVETSDRRVVRGSAEIGAGTFYSGERVRGLAVLEWRPNRHWHFTLTYDHNEVWLPEGDFRIELATARLVLSFTPDISWITFSQWDNVSDKLGINSRLRWIVEDGREFFVVFNHGLDTEDDFRSERTEAVLKVEWTFRF
jgi:hypothetical protein